MMEYSCECVMILMALLGTAGASVPSVDQLLDRFATNADSHSGSFKIKLENKREVVIRQTDSDFLAPGKRQEQYCLDCRWDGHRMRLTRQSRIGSGTTRLPFPERVSYESFLYEGSEQVYYRREDGLEKEAVVTYQDHGLPKDSCFNEVATSVVSWVWGYFPEEGGGRIDEFLRQSPTARVRPKTEPINNSECYVLEADSRDAKYTIWFDPVHGYNFARLHREQPRSSIVVENRAFRKYEQAWITVETEWEVQLMHLPESDMSYSQKTVVTEFEIDPNHDMLRSFNLDDIPEGTKAVFVSSRGFPMPGKFQWCKGKPVPCVDENTLAQLDRAAENIVGSAVNVSTSGSGKLSLDGASGNDAAPLPHCGLHCLYLLMKVYGQKPNFASLIKPTYLDQPNGSTLSGLKKAVEDAGLHAEIMLRANTRVLRSCPGPAILHVKGNETSRDYDHYILCVEVKGPWARICNPPGSVRLMSLDELSSRWDGKGLVVANVPIQLTELIRRETLHLFLPAGAVVLALLVASQFRRYIPWREIVPGIPGRSALSVAQAGGLVMVSLVIGLLSHSITEGGFLVYPDGVIAAQQAHASDFIPRIDLETTKQLHEKGVVFVDARRKSDFDAGHVERAINIPVDANDTIRRDAIRNLSRSDAIVVYCQSVNCAFAETVAGKLRVDGFFDVSIFSGGWIEWSTGIRPQVITPKNSKPGTWRLNKDGTASSK